MKKTFWENRPVAWIVLAVCVVFSLLFSGGQALKDLREQTALTFYQGVNGDGLCIYRDLMVRSECAYNLASTAANYENIDSALVEKARELSNQLAAATDVQTLFSVNAQCHRAVEDLYTAMENTALSANDKSFAYREYKEFVSRADTISRDMYNDQAASFNAVLDGFPAGLIGSVTGVEPLALFIQS